MSRRKANLSKEFSDRLLILMERLGYGGRQRDKFAKKIGITGAFLSNMINLDSGPSFALLLGLSKDFPEANIRWLLTGKGEPIENPQNQPADPERAELLRMTSEILDSNGSYAASLSANIHSFHEAISTARELGVMKDEIADIKKAIRITAGKTREGDPPEKKDELLQKRAISSG